MPEDSFIHRIDAAALIVIGLILGLGSGASALLLGAPVWLVLCLCLSSGFVGAGVAALRHRPSSRH